MKRTGKQWEEQARAGESMAREGIRGGAGKSREAAGRRRRSMRA